MAWPLTVAYTEDQVINAALGYVAQTHNKNLLQAASAPGTQEFRGTIVALRGGTTITNIVLYATVAAASLTLAKVGIYDTAGNLLASSASAHAAVNGATGNLVIPLSAPYVVPSTGAYFFTYVFVGTTPPTLLRMANTSGSGNPLSGKVCPHFGTGATTDLPSTTAAVTTGATAFAYWFGAT